MVSMVFPMLPQQQLQGVTTEPQKGIEHFNSSGKPYTSMDRLAKQLSASAVVGDDRNKTSIVANGAGENRIDYTDVVKRKYFEQQQLQLENDEKGYTTSFTVHRKEDGKYHDTVNVTSTEPNSNINESENKNQMLGGQDRDRNQMETCSSRPHTPPLTLYASNGLPPLSLTPSSNSHSNSNSNNPATDESAGYLSPGPGMDIMDSVEEDNSPDFFEMGTVPPLPNLSSEDITLVSSQCSVDSSRGSISTANRPLIKQPVLYSAIGSLEHANFNSLTNLNKRFMAPSKEFCKPGRAPGIVQSILIPPARHHQVEQKSQQQQYRSTTNSSSALQGTIPSTAGGTDLSKYQQIVRDADSQREVSNHITTNNNFDETKYKNTKNKDDPSISTSITPGNKSNQTERSERSHPTDVNLPSYDNRDTITDTSKGSNQKSTRGSQSSNSRKSKLTRKVTYDSNGKVRKSKSKKIEMFRPSSDAYTPRIERKKIKFKAAEARPSFEQMSSPMGTLQRPNVRDALRRVAMIMQRHIVKIESRFEHHGIEFSNSATHKKSASNDGLFYASMRDVFSEDAYRTPTYKCNMARIPMARPGIVYGLRKVKVHYKIPTETEIYDFGHQLFKSVQLSSECSIVCLIYVERLMEVAKVPLLACTWRPIFMCGLLLASKVWQDLSSWNIEFSSVYPQFSLEAINKLELNFLRHVKWDLYISSSCYAKYYFALRSLVEKQDFRQRYNRMVGVDVKVGLEDGLMVQERTERVKEKALLQLSRSMIW